jgi:hypothetical protein
MTAFLTDQFVLPLPARQCFPAAKYAQADLAIYLAGADPYFDLNCHAI